MTKNIFVAGESGRGLPHSKTLARWRGQWMICTQRAGDEHAAGPAALQTAVA